MRTVDEASGAAFVAKTNAFVFLAFKFERGWNVDFCHRIVVEKFHILWLDHQLVGANGIVIEKKVGVVGWLFLNGRRRNFRL